MLDEFSKYTGLQSQNNNVKVINKVHNGYLIAYTYIKINI
ncbi:hypothetical protein JCM19376_25720 [Fusibacter bizertensis]